MRDNLDKEALKANFRKRVEKFEQYFNDPEQINKIFTELGFTYVEDSCDGFCPECEQMLKCKVYKEIKDDWEWICNSKVKMSGSSKMKMSGLRSAKLPNFIRRQDGRKGHFHGKAEGTKEIARDTQSNRGEPDTGRGSGDFITQ